MVPAARLERELDYRRLALVELGGVVVFQAVSLSSAFAGMGAWSGVVGWWVQQVVSVALIYRLSTYRPRLCWDMTRARVMLAYGIGYCASVWVWQLRTLLNPLVVLPWAGAAAAGYVGLALKFVDVLSILKSTAARLAIAALARLNGDRRRALSAMSEGMRLQVLGVGAMLAGFALAAPYLMPLLFREQWVEWEPAMAVFPYLAVGVLGNAMFGLHTAVLYVLGRSWLVTAFNAVYVTLLYVAALYFIPRYGIVGVGFAEVTAMSSYIVVHLLVRRALGSPDYRLAAIWATAAGMLLFVDALGWMTCAGAVAAALWPPTWRTLEGYLRMVRPTREEVSHA
jgi:O-antigen/teichoic acid export membrane protein